jgi:GcrA cell cycle regulator|tara:strand:+ start:77 stop:568 length:492 start_codon:yes stop_codon:yes gene_type:complete
MSNWDDFKIDQLRSLWGKKTASQIAELIGGVSRNAVIGKAHRLNLSAKIKKRISSHYNSVSSALSNKSIRKRGRRSKFKSLLLDKDFEPAKSLHLEQLTDHTCKYMEGHPNEPGASFCGRKTVEKFSYCPLHLMIIFQPKGKKEDLIDEDDFSKFIEKKIKSA